MRFHPFHKIFPFEISRRLRRRMIREHSRWLTQALRSGRRVPQIPLKPVSDGGFSKLAATPHGRERAARWWRAALENLD